MNIKWNYTFMFPTNCRLFKDKVFLSDNVLPDSCEEAKKMLKVLELSKYDIMHV